MQAKVTVRVPAHTLVDLNDYVGRQFGIKRHGAEVIVKLDKVTNRDVQLSYAKSEREDKFTVSQAKFRKFYSLLTSAKVEASVEEN
uniref:Uncharacterized protein n=1 Tax=Pseudomonas phage RVTF4 TaxID=3236931 RepID=A0AB39CDE2_9VIRU